MKDIPMRRSAAFSAELVTLVSDGTRRARVAITGTSMQPLLRAGMVVDIEPLDGPPRIGDILVFAAQSGLVAHRLVGGERFAFRAHSGIVPCPHADPQTAFLTGGDAHPERGEVVPRHLVVGRVSAVWTSAAPEARRVDDWRFHRLGPVIARTRNLRSLLRKGRTYAALLFAAPARIAPPAAFAALTAATHEFERRSFAAAIAKLESVPPELILETARRHHAGGLVARWLDEAAQAGIAAPSDLRAAFQRIRWTNALQAGRVLTCVGDVRDRFAAAGIAHIFLKGGARLAAGEPDADLQFAGDLDVLVPADRAAAALAALRAAGYRDIRPPHERGGYAALHHREPLRSPHVDLPVEVHVALTPPPIVSRPLNFEALAPRTRTVDGPAGEVRVLDHVAAALHLAYHARDLGVWRDIVLLSRALRGFDRAARVRFDADVRTEHRDGLRLASAVAAADALAGSGPPPSRNVRRYLAWAEIREDLPRGSAHVEFLEALAGRCPIHILRLDRSRRDLRALLRCWARNAMVLPVMVRIIFWRRDRKRLEAAAECANAGTPNAATENAPTKNAT